MSNGLPRESIGQTQPERNPSLLVRDAIRMTFHEKTLEVSWWMLCLKRSRGQNPRGLRPLGFWPWDNIHHDTSSAFSNNVPLWQWQGWIKCIIAASTDPENYQLNTLVSVVSKFNFSGSLYGVVSTDSV